MKRAAILAGAIGAVWLATKVAQWTMAQALRIGALGLALWFVATTVRELMR